ncbi:hypothetical protein PO902_14160 [Planococcus maritimus]|nr:hypothetical protein [Planococcus sp. SK3692]MDE4086187.1 hypothetical protein [Planococcus maritimus]
MPNFGDLCISLLTFEVSFPYKDYILLRATNTYHIQRSIRYASPRKFLRFGKRSERFAERIDEQRKMVTALMNNIDMESSRIPAGLIAKTCVYFGIAPNQLFSVVEMDNETGEVIKKFQAQKPNRFFKDK